MCRPRQNQSGVCKLSFLVALWSWWRISSQFLRRGFLQANAVCNRLQKWTLHERLRGLWMICTSHGTRTWTSTLPHKRIYVRVDILTWRRKETPDLCYSPRHTTPLPAPTKLLVLSRICSTFLPSLWNMYLWRDGRAWLVALRPITPQESQRFSSLSAPDGGEESPYSLPGGCQSRRGGTRCTQSRNQIIGLNRAHRLTAFCYH